ncbi:DUF4033 domain-containing protein [Candidatus Synechococcus calcipolaris G9]|uniref:DUF4033 domain-containing protein n=1 Tax=Candidatus Synechococcus calcipolaris G9 TaxID=1497997 RepID=A0ABT6F0T7_9SYNE|nr:DUF4033 domain-containing protein [Candidatus Synechococcus calcipolaris]MDG2991418.1 DUF4033 domain-containing protein [Candidatus Synechococcus calcipolaris G9]
MGFNTGLFREEPVIVKLAKPPLTTPIPTASASVYQDTWLDRLCIYILKAQISRVIGQKTSLPGYEGFVALSKQVMIGRDTQEQQAAIAHVLRSTIPPWMTRPIRRLFQPNRWVCETNAWFATVLFQWLVGPCDRHSVDIVDQTGQTHQQNSGVHIQKCRYLEQSQCVGLCINLCKVPTQTFFSEELGIPLTLTPNFEDFSCEMVFGQQPPPLETEPAYHQPCIAQTHGSSPCPKVR